MITKKQTSILLFILGFGLFMFTRLSKLVPLIPTAILIAPIFILRFIRIQPTARGIWLTLLGFLLSFNIALWGLFEFDDPSLMTFYSLVRSSLLAIIWFLPFMIDRMLYPKFQAAGIWSTLTFPIITTAVFFLSSLEGPFDDGSGTLSSFSYGTLTFVQARSLFGIWSFVFLYSWLFSAVNFCWENQFHWKKIRNLAIMYPSILLLVLLFGVAKTSSTNPNPETVKIAAIVLIPEDGNAVRMERIFNQKVVSPVEKVVARIGSLTKKAAENGARIVSFQEFTLTISEQDKSSLVERYQRIARENNIYLSITYAYFANEGKGENIHLFIDPNGKIQLDYTKRYLLGFASFGETAVFKKGPEIIQSADTPYGRIGISICRDLGFPSYTRQAARKNVDIMLSPSYDWPKSPGPWYLTSTIENGFSLVRPTYNGYSYAADYHGKVLTHMDSEQTQDGIMYAEVPTKGIKTLYPMVGDALGWVCLIGMLGLIGFSRRKS